MFGDKSTFGSSKKDKKFPKKVNKKKHIYKILYKKLPNNLLIICYLNIVR